MGARDSQGQGNEAEEAASRAAAPEKSAAIAAAVAAAERAAAAKSVGAAKEADDEDEDEDVLTQVAQQEDFLVSIYFETLADGGARPAEEMVRWLRYAIDTYGDHANFARIDGKPLSVQRRVIGAVKKALNAAGELG